MIKKLSKAIQLRTDQNYIQSEEIFKILIIEYPNQGSIFYHYAWLCDNMERELEAVPKYEKALELGLEGEELKGCYLGLGSTYRCIGEYSKSNHIFKKAILDFPDHAEFKVFQAMTLYNLKEHQEAMNLLLRIIAETSSNPGIQSYKKAILYYSDKLDQKFL